MSTPHTFLLPDGGAALSTDTPSTTLTGVHIKSALRRESGDPSPTSEPGDAITASPASQDAPAVTAMLPTPPASLPASYTTPHFATPSATTEHATLGDPAGFPPDDDSVALGPSPQDEWRGTTPPFGLDELAEVGDGGVAMDVEEPQEMEHDGLASLHDPGLTQGLFSAVAPIHRPFRSRYASSSTDSLELDAPPSEFADHDFDLGAPHKRSHSEVSRSLGNTPPANFDTGATPALTRPSSLFSPPEPSEEPAVSPRWRNSFSYDAQRAEPTTLTSVISATAAAPLAPAPSSSSLGLLRRRARAPTDPEPSGATSLSASSLNLRSVGDRGSSKRRRSGTLSTSGTHGEEASRAAPSTSRLPPWLARGTSSSSAVPVLSTSTEEDVRTIRRRGRLSLACFPGSAGSSADPSTSFSRTATLYAPTAQHTRQAYDALLSHAARSDALATRGEGLLREAADALARAEAEVDRASALVSAQEADRERQRERDVAQRLPSTEGLRDPREARERPVVGIRLGEGWAPSAPPTGPASPPSPQASGRRRRSSLWSLSSPLSSPPPDAEQHSPPLDSSSSSASSRARNFLTHLRARRPRLSRDSTAVSPPESGSGSASASPPAFSRASTFGTLSSAGSGSASSSASALRSWTLPSPPLAETLAGSAFDDSAEQDAAERLNRRLLERRQVSESVEAASAPQVHPEPETALWGETSTESVQARRLRGPTQGANERWRFGLGRSEAFPPASASTATTLATAAGSARLSTPGWRRFPRVAGSDGHAAGEEMGTRVGDAHFRERLRDDSPSPRRRDLFRSTAALDAAEEGAARMVHGIGRPSIRLPRPDPIVERSSSRPRLEFDDVDDERRTGGSSGPAWAAPGTLPLMLPSGSDGTRMLFPHPAAAAGPVGMERQRSASPFGTYGPDHMLSPTDSPRDESPFLGRGRMPWDEMPSSAYASRRSFSRFDPWADDQPSTSTAAGATAAAAEAVPLASRVSPRHSSLAEALSHIGPRATSGETSTDANLRRRRGIPIAAEPSRTDDQPGPDDAPALERRRGLEPYRRTDETVEERLAQHRHSRMERLQALRRERNVMRTLLGGPAGPASPTTAISPARAEPPDSWMAAQWHEPASPPAAPRSPGARGRGLGEFLRGLGAGVRFGGRGALIGIWDDDFREFMTRDSAALDPRNYLDDDEFDTSYEALIRLSERLGDAKPRGVSKDALVVLRKFKYAEWPISPRSTPPRDDSIASTSAHSLDLPAPLARKGHEKEARCGICLCDYEDDDDCMLGRCDHGFHEECLASWLTQKGTCPVCRRDHTT